MPSQIFPFDSIANYTPSDSNKIGVSGGNATLKLQNDPDNDFNEDFADDTGHTYESDKGEFSGGQFQQKSQRPANSTFGASYTIDINGNFGNGVLTGTAYNGAAAVSGKLDLSGASNKYIDYDADLNADMQQTGCVRFKWTPKYTGAGSFQYLITNVEGVSLPNNRIRIYHQSTLLFVAISDQAGGSIVSFAETFSPIADTEYEIELNWDITTGATRLFVDGNQLGSTQTGTGTRDANIGLVRLGKDLNGNGNADFLIDDLIFFDSVQHTSNYTPGYTVPDYVYLETYDLLPEMHYTGAGTLIAATNFQTSFTGSPRIAIDIGQSGEYTYWNGVAWVTGGDDYDHATSPADWLANIATMPVLGEVYGQFIIYYPNSNTQSAFADLTITLTSQIYPIDNPYLDINSRWYLDDLEALTEGSPVTSGSDEIKYILKQGSTWYYHDGSDWAESDGTYSQANTAAEITTYKSDFTDSRIYFAARVFLHSADGSTTPTLGTLTIQYSYAGETPDTINECLVVFDGTHSDATPGDDTIIVYPINNHVKYKDKKIILKKYNTVTLDDSGYGEVSLVENKNMEGNQGYVIQWSKTDKEYVVIPDEATKYYNDLVEWEEA